jgi:Holliday junction resolvasome RuvABC endonuclease subunit
VAPRSAAGTGYPTLAQLKANPIRGPKGETPLTDLALDLSSTCVGWAVSADRKLERYGKFVFRSTAGVGEKLTSFEKYLDGLIGTVWPERLLVERPSAQGNTAIRHLELLGIVRKVWFARSGMEIEKEHLIHPKSVKAAMRVARGANHDQNKIIMLNKVNSLYSLSLKWDRNSKIKSDDDIADAIAVLTTFWRRNSRK